MLLQIDPTTAVNHSIPILAQWGIAGILLVVVFYIAWKQDKYLKEELVKKDLEIERLRLLNKEVTEQMLTQSINYSKILLEHEKDNITSLNDVTNSLNQVIILVKDLNNKS